MKTATKNTQSGYTFTKATYNPALDYLENQVLFKEKLERAKETFKNMACQKKLWRNFRKSKINKSKRDVEFSTSLFI